MLQVGSLGARWVLMPHADPWLLTVNVRNWSQSRLTSNRIPFIGSQHNIPFMRKRCRRGVQQEVEEPQPKRSTVDRQEGEDREDAEGLNRDTAEKPKEDEQLGEQQDGEENVEGNAVLNSEETHSEKGEEKQAEHGNVEVNERRNRRARGDSSDADRREEDLKQDADVNE